MNPGGIVTNPENVFPPPTRTVTDVTCLACGCLCDDLAVTVGRDEVIAVSSACEVGRTWFLSEGRRSQGPAAAVEGLAVESRLAVDRAVEVLRVARAPVVFGLTATVTETVREALGLADLVGARVVLDRGPHDLGRVAAFQNQGRVSATLGEVKNRADVVVFWGADPVRTHPRHWERYSVEPKGRFVPQGRAGRSVVVVDAGKTATAEKADLVFAVAPDRQFETLVTLRLLVRGIAPPDRPAGEDLARLARVLRHARYGALFFQTDAESSGRSGPLWEAAASLVRDLNEFTRFVMLGMGGPGNLHGAEAALTWQAGYTQGVDYRLGYPSPLDDRDTLDGLLRRGETDAVLAVTDAWPARLSDDARAHLATIPLVVIGPRATADSERPPTVGLATATPGFDAGGTVVRSDGVVLPSRPVLDPRLPSDGDLIRRLVERLRDAPVKAN